jgi:integrase
MKKRGRYKVETGIYKMPDGTFEVLFSLRDPFTRQSRSLRRTKGLDGEYIHSLTMARRVREKLKEILLSRKENPMNPLWPQAVMEMIQEMKDDFYQPTTILNYESSLRKHTFDVWGDKTVQEISTLDIKLLFKEKDWGKHQRKNMVKHIKRVFSFCVEQEYLTRNPMPKIRVKAPVKLKSFLNEAELKKLIFESKIRRSPWAPIYEFASHTGMRDAELRGLEKNCVDMNNDLIYVLKTQASGKEGQDAKGNAFFKPTKSRVDRVIPISPPLKELLKELMLTESNFVLPRLKAWMQGEQSKQLKAFLREIDLPEIRFHDLRASWCTLMLSKGVPAVYVMQIGGWKEMKTMDRYIRMAGVEVKGKTDCLECLRVNTLPADVLKLDSKSE